ncbi:carbohydrate kinase [Roseobacter sp. YSTF-M11]|uniref:Carbohydrate kinase n=1 Tax=Roseobacter insulae TaxID=2859783 RepID=A0A9X1FYQ3_9RHOB|nr:carbohydrate kinase [Roseobacter insulae]MBW4710121.1 carbohydrate kinase [Roseobacter insulae]
MILCCGEALIDMIPAVSDQGQNCFVPHSGGAVFNTSIALGRLGAATGFVTGLSTDLFGTQLTQSLSDSKVDCSLAVYSNLPSTLAFVQLNNGQATYTFYDENTAGRSLTPNQLPDVPDDVSALFFGGISLISEPCAEFYAALALREADDRLIMLDPNIRAAFVQDETRYRERLERMIAVANIVKVSDEDLDWIVPGDQDLAGRARALCAKGPHVVIVTRGGEGAMAFLSDGTQTDVPAHRVAIVDTVGAGDTFNAGVLAKLSERGLLNASGVRRIGAADMSEALSFGASVAAVTVGRAGANPPWAHELS